MTAHDLDRKVVFAVTTPVILACARDPETGAVIDLWTEGDPPRWCAGNDDRSLIVAFFESAEEAFNAWVIERDNLEAEPIEFDVESLYDDPLAPHAPGMTEIR